MIEKKELVSGEFHPPVAVQNWKDQNGCPTGGYIHGVGYNIIWQNGALEEAVLPEIEANQDIESIEDLIEVAEATEALKVPNGAFVEDILNACIIRLDYFQDSEFANDYNKEAIEHIEKAIAFLDARTEERKNRNVEGTHQI